MTRLLFVGVLMCAGANAGNGQAGVVERSADLATALGFERDPSAAYPPPWVGGPAETIRTDLAEVHGGTASARIDRTAESPNEFSTLTLAVPMDFAGQRIELRGYIRTREVEGFAGLWMRQDGEARGLEFDNMQRRRLRGTTPWTEHAISLPVHPDGTMLYFGFLLGGTGTAWVDDLQLLVDGKPVWEAPKAVRMETILDRDREFDAGSRIVLTGLRPDQVGSLATLCRVWGLLKYHHPVVTSGQRHWDYELFRVLPAVLAAGDGAAARAVLLDWVNGVGPVDVARPPPQDADVHIRPDMRWIDCLANENAELAGALRGIHAAGPGPGTQFYVSLAAGVRNPVFSREPAYAQIKDVDAGYRLLALFRLWNIIQYWFPYRDLIADWDAVLVESIPRVALAGDRDAFERELMAVIACVGDTHANLWSSIRVRPPVGDAIVPATVRFIEDRAVVTAAGEGSDAGTGGLRRGDVVLAIDGQPVEELVRRWSPLYAASNEPTRRRDIARSLFQGPDGPVRLTIRRGDETMDVLAERVAGAKGPVMGRTHDLPGPAFRRLSDDIAYLKLSTVKAAEVPAYLEQAAGTKGWIIDIRNYPSEFVVFALGNHLVERETEFARFTRGDQAQPGVFAFGEAVVLKPRAPRYGGRIVILVDEVSQSSAEYTAMAFRSVPGAVVVGSTTAGADGNVSRIPLPGGLHTTISGIGVFYPDKRPTQRVGIVPDIEARPTLAGIREGRDEVLEAAVRVITGPDVSDDEIRRIATPRE